MLRRIAFAAVLMATAASAQPDPIAASPGLMLRTALGADGVQICRCAQEAAGPCWAF